MTITIITSFIILLGITLSAYSGIQMRHQWGNGRYYVVLPTIGEGIWASVIPLVAGILAIKAAAPGFNKCLLQAHLALAIIGAFGQFVLMCIEISYCLVSAAFYITPYTHMLAIVAILSFVNFVLLIVSSSYNCCVMPGCCNDESQIVQHNHGQMVYVASGAQVVQQQPGVVLQQPGMVLQQPGMVPQQPGMVLQQAQPYPQKSANPDQPPSYQ